VTVTSPDSAADARPPATAIRDHSVLVGYGRVGSLVGNALTARAEAFVVIEDGATIVARLRENGIEAIAGNAVRADVLAAANLAGARRLFVAIPNCFEAVEIVERARALNPSLTIVARAHSETDVQHLTSAGADTVIMGEREIALGMIEHVFPGMPRRNH
jgi:monovalent cation:H+ antiporter-2, CPA2 family